MKNLVLVAALFVSQSAFAISNQLIFQVTSGFGIRNLSAHQSVADWPRHFLLSNYGLVEAVHGQSSFGGKCEWVSVQVDNSSQRYFDRAKIKYSVTLPKNTSVAVCQSFSKMVSEIAIRSSMTNQARITVVLTDQGVTQSITVQFESRTYKYGP